MGFFVNPYINIDMKHIQYYNRINKNKAPQLTLQRYIKVLYTGFTRLCPTKTEPGSIAASTCSPKQKWSAACLWADNVQTHPHLFSSKHGVSLSLTLLLWPIYLFFKKAVQTDPLQVVLDLAVSRGVPHQQPNPAQNRRHVSETDSSHWRGNRPKSDYCTVLVDEILVVDAKNGNF